MGLRLPAFLRTLPEPSPRARQRYRHPSHRNIPSREPPNKTIVLDITMFSSEKRNIRMLQMPSHGLLSGKRVSLPYSFDDLFVIPRCFLRLNIRIFTSNIKTIQIKYVEIRPPEYISAPPLKVCVSGHSSYSKMKSFINV